VRRALAVERGAEPGEHGSADARDDRLDLDPRLSVQVVEVDAVDRRRVEQRRRPVEGALFLVDTGVVEHRVGPSG
jgi:hypothetical protein